MIFSRIWAMPSADTFSIKPIGDFVRKYLNGVSVDPFARNNRLATYTNDLNPNTAADYHMDAVAFLNKLAGDGVKADVVLLDPPYSPRQISECYAAAGLTTSMKDTQSTFWTNVRRSVYPLCRSGTVVLSFGWNSTGMGRAWDTLEIMLVAHGGAHNDTICIAQRYDDRQQTMAEQWG